MAEKIRVAIVAHGRRKIPSDGWGAVENIIYQYALRLQARGHEPIIVNVKWRWATWIVARLWMKRRIDVCHVHNERALSWLAPVAQRLRLPVIVTSHYFFNAKNLDGEAEWGLKHLALCNRHICLNEETANLIRERVPGAMVEVLPNGTEVSQFKFAKKGNGRAICVGKLQARKRQRIVARLLTDAGIGCDFVGPLGDDALDSEHAHLHLGEWTRQTLHDKLTDYSVLVLYSEAEGQALVVVEALAAGLSVVVSTQASQNLDLSQPMVTVVDGEENLAEACKAAIAHSDRHREQARQYALDNFDYDNLVFKYESLLKKLSGPFTPE